MICPVAPLLNVSMKSHTCKIKTERWEVECTSLWEVQLIYPPPQHNLLVSNRIVMFLILHFYSCIKILKCELRLNSHSVLSVISLVLILSKPSYWYNITLDTGCHKGIKPPNSNKMYFTEERAVARKNIMLLALLIFVQGGRKKNVFDSFNYSLQVSTPT